MKGGREDVDTPFWSWDTWLSGACRPKWPRESLSPRIITFSEGNIFWGVPNFSERGFPGIYGTQIKTLSTLVTNSLTNWLTPVKGTMIQILFFQNALGAVHLLRNTNLGFQETLVNCPTQPTCLAHLDLCICQLSRRWQPSLALSKLFEPLLRPWNGIWVNFFCKICILDI